MSITNYSLVTDIEQGKGLAVDVFESAYLSGTHLTFIYLMEKLIILLKFKFQKYLLNRIEINF